MNRDGDSQFLRSASHAITADGFHCEIVGVRVEMTSGPSLNTWKVFLPVGCIDFFNVTCKFEGDTSEREIELKPAPALFAKETIIGK